MTKADETTLVSPAFVVRAAYAPPADSSVTFVQVPVPGS